MRKFRTKKVVWLVTRKCNLRCKSCAIYDENFVELDEEAKLSMIKRIAKFVWTKNIELTGGEPTTLGNELLRIVDTFDKLKFKVSVRTNSVYLCESKVYRKSFAKVVKDVTFDVAAAPGERCVDVGWDTKTRLGWMMAEDEVLKNIPNRRVHMTLFPWNIDSAWRVARSAKERGVRVRYSIGAKPIEGCDAVSDEGSEYMFIKKEDIELAKRRLYGLVAGKSHVKNIDNTHTELAVMTDKIPAENHVICGEFRNLVIDADGMVRCCEGKRGKDLRSFEEWTKVRKWTTALRHWQFEQRESCGPCHFC